MSYFKRVLIAVDQLVNTITGGSEDETISSRVGKLARTGDPTGPVLQRIINFLFDDPRHCQDAIEEDEGINSHD